MKKYFLFFILFFSIHSYFAQDADGDGIANSLDLDDDNDGILDTAECNSANRITSGNFVVASASAGNVTSVSGWVTIGINNTYKIYQGTTGLQFNVNYGHNQSIAQNITGVFTTINGTGPIIDLTGIRGKDGINSLATNGTQEYSSSEAFTTTFSYAGTNYLTISSSFGKTTNLIVSPLNGASIVGGTPTIAIGTYKDLSLQLPLGVPTSGQLMIYYDITPTIPSEINESLGYADDGDDMEIASITLNSCKDTDGDGIPDFLDLDSDGDECPDAIEGGGPYTPANLVTSTMSGGNLGTGYTGTSATPVTQNFPTPVGNGSTTMGVPTIAGSGQTIGDSQNKLVNSCICYKPSTTTGTSLPTNHGITALGRAGANNSNWPIVRNGAWTALEAKSKGFVINRMPSATAAQVTTTPALKLGEPVNTAGTVAVIVTPVEGMIFYDTILDCLKINTDGTATGWKCFNSQTCPFY